MTDGGGGPPRARRTAAERREDVVDAGVHEFADHGYHAASTAAIARRAGVSQPYVYALFRDKRTLFLHCQERVLGRIRERFLAAAGGTSGEEALVRMGQAYRDLLGDRVEIMCQLQGYAAAGDPVVRAAVREGFLHLFDEVVRVTGLPARRVADFFAGGMYLNVAAALELPDAVLPPPPTAPVTPGARPPRPRARRSR